MKYVAIGAAVYAIMILEEVTQALAQAASKKHY